MSLSHGQCATHVAWDGMFVANLGSGTSIQVTISGKLGGTINGLPVSGHGSLEYTYNAGDANWSLDADGLATGPALPAGNIVYLPSGKASGSVDVKTTGSIVEQTSFRHKKDRYSFKLKGRVQSVTIQVLQDATCAYEGGSVCDADCSAEANQSCEDTCIALQGGC